MPFVAAGIPTVVLPVPTLLEDSDLVGSYGHHWLAESRPLVEAPDGVLHEVEILRRLADLLGIGSGWPQTAMCWPPCWWEASSTRPSGARTGFRGCT